LTQGHVLRHAPAESLQGRDAAVIDIAQDHLSERGVLIDLRLELTVGSGPSSLR
jgi:hypothetical protein